MSQISEWFFWNLIYFFTSNYVTNIKNSYERELFKVIWKSEFKLFIF